MKKCRQCGADFIPNKFTPNHQEFCSVKCQSMSIERQKREDLTDRIVKRNIYITMNRLKKGSIKYNQITSEMIIEKRAQIIAWRERKANPIPKPVKVKTYRACIICGKEYEAKGKAVVCGDECRKADGRNKYYADRDDILKKMRDKYEPKPKTDQACNQCGDVFMGHKGDAYCSDVCRQRAKQARKAKRRAIKLCVHYEPVDALKVFKRDGWRCQLCKKKLNPKHRGLTVDDAPELDHIIPWAQGGEHSYRNTQCACRKCNGEKNDKIRGQIRLFG